MGARSVWRSLVALQLLLCIVAGFVSLALPEEPEPSGYYDGDGDDAVASPERVATLANLAVIQGPTPLPVPTSVPLAILAAPASPPPPGRSQPPLLRSPPA